MTRAKPMLGFSAILLCIAIAAMAAQEPPDTAGECMDDESRERVRGIITDGIDDALKEHVKQVFDMWLRDDTDQPKRAITGMHIGIRAYVRSRAAALRWAPPKCEESKK